MIKMNNLKEQKSKIKSSIDSKEKVIIKDKFYAKLSFFLSLGFWIPLFNIGFSLTSIIIALKTIKKIYSEPQRYSGMMFCVFALVISFSSLIMTIAYFVIYGFSDMFCSSICSLN
jgi:hypothetical protein